MSKLFKHFMDFFKLKSPCCKKPLESVGLHHTKYGSENVIRECTNCKNQYI